MALKGLLCHTRHSGQRLLRRVAPLDADIWELLGVGRAPWGSVHPREQMVQGTNSKARFDQSDPYSSQFCQEAGIK